MFEVLAKGHPDAWDALSAVQVKIEIDESSCHRCIQPMGPKYPECHGRIWKYDFAPASVKGSTRKSWRLVVFVKDVETSPKRLIAMACYSKSGADQMSLKELAQHLQIVSSPDSR